MTALAKASRQLFCRIFRQNILAQSGFPSLLP
jgi:hypothetical protein